jgi:hypothetical protein
MNTVALILGSVFLIFPVTCGLIYIWIRLIAWILKSIYR